MSLANVNVRTAAHEPGARPPAPAPRVAIFVVAYNAVTTLTKVLDRIPDEVWQLVEDVYVFDDASKDETALLGRAYKSERGRDKLHIYRHEKNQGYGGNQKLGYQYAIEKGFDFVVLLHGDGQYAPEALPNLLAPLLEGRADAVFGSRMMTRFTALKGGMPLYKYLGNKILSTYQNFMLDSRLSEFHSGYRAYSVAALRRLPLSLNSNDFHFDTEIIIQLMAHGFRIKEVPIPTYYGDEICYVNGVKYARDVFRTTMDYRLHRGGFKSVPKYVVASEERYPGKFSDQLSSHAKIVDRVQPGAVALDVGAGSGVLGKALRTRGLRVVGIDLARPPDTAAAAYDRFIEQDIDQGMILPADVRFDVAIFGDVLEHVRRPDALLASARDHLKPGGRIIASVGNVALWYCRLSLLFGRFDYRPRGILDETHVKLYTLDTFRALLERAGLRVTGLDVTPIPLPALHPAFGRAPLSWLHRAGHVAARVWKRMFAYQFILEAEVAETR